MRTRLCIKPVRFSSRMPASTKGYPVSPWHHFANSSLLFRHWMASYWGLKLLVTVCGKCHKICIKNSRHISSFKKVMLELFSAFFTTLRMLTVPNLRWGPSLEVPATEGVFLFSSYKWINCGSILKGAIFNFDLVKPIASNGTHWLRSILDRCLSKFSEG